MKNSSQLWWRWLSWLAPGFSTVQPTTWSAPADFLSIRNCTCMSIQPSLRLRPSTFGTSRILVRYIFAPSDALVMPVAAFTALASADPTFSPLFVTFVLLGALLAAEALGPTDEPCRGFAQAGNRKLLFGIMRLRADRPDVPPQNRWHRFRDRQAFIISSAAAASGSGLPSLRPISSTSSMSFCCKVTSASGTSGIWPSRTKGPR